MLCFIAYYKVNNLTRVPELTLHDLNVHNKMMLFNLIFKSIFTNILLSQKYKKKIGF